MAYKGNVYIDVDRLEELIKLSGKTKRYLCAAIGRPPYYLRDISRSGNAMSPENVATLASELDTTPEYLMGQTDDKKSPPKMDELDAELYSLLLKCPQEKKEALMSFLQAFVGGSK